MYLFCGNGGLYYSSDSGVTIRLKDLGFLYPDGTTSNAVIGLACDNTYIFIITRYLISTYSRRTEIYRAKPDMLYWERYDDGAIFPLNGIFYEDGLYGLYGDNRSIFATNGDNTPVNKIQNLTADSKFFSLQPGQNILKLDVDTGLAVANIRYRNRFTGVGC